MRVFPVFFLLSFIGWMSFAPAQTAPSPVVIELFSSEVCGFCPPADKFLGELATKDGIIALSCHVDYFPGPKSALAQSFCSSRQNRYIDNMDDVDTNYTPQMVINGHYDAIGYKPDKVSAAILKGRSDKIGQITLTPVKPGEYNMSLPALRSPQNTDLILVSFRAPKTVAVTQGPNLGKRITYTNVIHSLHNIGVWDGTAQMRSFNTAASPNIGGFAVLAQDRRTGQIIAAGATGLR